MIKMSEENEVFVKVNRQIWEELLKKVSKLEKELEDMKINWWKL